MTLFKIFLAACLAIMAYLALPLVLAGFLGGNQHHITMTITQVQIPANAHAFYVSLARQDATNEGVDPDIFERQINQESGFDPNTRGSAGEIGIAQFMPDTARSLGIDPSDPIASLKGAAHLMASYLNLYQGDYAKALAAYNAGSNTVRRAVLVGGEHWLGYMPAETQHYVSLILQGRIQP